jgi:hypothetical protein
MVDFEDLDHVYAVNKAKAVSKKQRTAEQESQMVVGEEEEQEFGSRQKLRFLVERRPCEFGRPLPEDDDLTMHEWYKPMPTIKKEAILHPEQFLMEKGILYALRDQFCSAI